MNTFSSAWTQDDNEFDDFKQAPATTFTPIDNTPSIKPPTDSTKSIPSIKPPIDNTKAISSFKPPIDNSKAIPSFKPSMPETAFPMCAPVKSIPETKPIEDLMSPDEDKYSVFRSLQQTSDKIEEWSAFSSVSCDATKHSEVEDSSQSNTPTFPSEFLSNPVPLEMQSDIFSSGNDLFNPLKATNSGDNDDFGDFLHAEVPTVTVVTSKMENLTTNSGFVSSSKILKKNVY